MFVLVIVCLIAASVKYEKDGVKSKGFGFVTFRHASSAKLALQESHKMIDGRMTQVGPNGCFDTFLKLIWF